MQNKPLGAAKLFPPTFTERTEMFRNEDFSPFHVRTPEKSLAFRETKNNMDKRHLDWAAVRPP